MGTDTELNKFLVGTSEKRDESNSLLRMISDYKPSWFYIHPISGAIASALISTPENLPFERLSVQSKS